MLKLKLAYLPPLLIYSSAGISGMTGIVGIFFLKDYLSLSASFIASIAFWAGIPWALKMPIGFLIDKYWSSKNIFVYLGAFLITISLLIMYFILTSRAYMELYFSIEFWFILSSILTPVGYVLQDVVADAMTVEAVENNLKKKKIASHLIKQEHTILQLYGRFAIILGSLLVGLINLYVFSNIDKQHENLNQIYANIYLLSLIIPFISVCGVIISRIYSQHAIETKSFKMEKLDYQIFIGSCIFVLFALFLGTLRITSAKEIILITSLILISILMRLLIKDFNREQKSTIIGTAIIIFVYRSLPGPGAGLNWYEIDILGFNQRFFSLLTVVSAGITLLGMLIFKKFMVNTSLSKLFVVLSVLSALLYLPSLFLYYGFHLQTAALTNGLVDAKFIAIMNTAAESPLSQVAMIPLLAWIAKNAPLKYKATFFAVFASFTNLALSAKELFTSYINKIFIIRREIYDESTNSLIEANYDSLDNLLIVIILITLFAPLITIMIIQKSRFRSTD